jgi:predicted cupin superfamily sugar epimerase
MTNDAQYWIDKLGLEKHPEGGYYRVTYTAATQIAQGALPEGYAGARPASTGIYFLLSNQGAGDREGHFSAFHRLRSDEMWHFYAGQPLVVHVIDPEGRYMQMLIGNDCEAGQNFQAVVHAGCWFASEPLLASSFALAGCTVSPGFDFADFELARRAEMSAQYPQHRALIARLTRR